MITLKAKEIISILTISNEGAKKEVQFIIDGHEGPVHECDKKHFENGGNQIFPVVTLFSKDQKLEFISLDQVKYRSPKIAELMNEFNKLKSVPSSAPSTSSTAETDALISQLREAVSRSQAALIQEKDNGIRNIRELVSARDRQLSEICRRHQQQLSAKDQQITANTQQCREQLDFYRQQFEVERAEHHTTRNCLRRATMHLRRDQSFYLKRCRKESGRRRQRGGEDEEEEEENEEVQDESDDEDEQ